VRESAMLPRGGIDPERARSIMARVSATTMVKEAPRPWPTRSARSVVLGTKVARGDSETFPKRISGISGNSGEHSNVPVSFLQVYSQGRAGGRSAGAVIVSAWIRCSARRDILPSRYERDFPHLFAARLPRSDSRISSVSQWLTILRTCRIFRRVEWTGASRSFRNPFGGAPLGGRLASAEASRPRRPSVAALQHRQVPGMPRHVRAYHCVPGEVWAGLSYKRRRPDDPRLVRSDRANSAISAGEDRQEGNGVMGLDAGEGRALDAPGNTC
jgi:hypothetical protein